MAQPLLTGLGIAAWQALAPDLPPPAAVAGYSVGELPACCVAGVFDADTALALAAFRAEAMDSAAAGEAGGLMALQGPGAAAQAQTPSPSPAGYPNKPIRWIVPYAPGGASDIVARMISDGLTDALGQKGRSSVETFLLPERVFNDPTARALIVLRKALNKDSHKHIVVEIVLDYTHQDNPTVWKHVKEKMPLQ